MVTISKRRGGRGARRRATPGGVFGAVSDPTRRRILDRLRAGALPVVEIASEFRVSRPAISKHLAVLEREHLVKAERRGRRRLYSLHAAPLQELDAWLAGYRQFWAARLVDLKAAAEALHREKGKESRSSQP